MPEASQGGESECHARRGSEKGKVSSRFRKDFLEKVSFDRDLEGKVGLLHRNRKKGIWPKQNEGKNCLEAGSFRVHVESLKISPDQKTF